MNDVTAAAERAVLGALLLGDGKTLHEVVAWLHSDDFADPWHQDVLRVIAGARGFVDANDVARGLIAWRGTAQAELGKMADLLHAAPSPGNVRSYAHMVLEASHRRRVAGLGVLLHAGALSSSRYGDGRAVAAASRIVRDVVVHERNRWVFALAEPGTVPVPTSTYRPPIEERLSADRLIRSFPERDVAVEQDCEVRFIGALINRPARAEVWTAAPAPASITSERWRPVYAAIGRLVEAGRPVDAVTVAWEVRRGVRVEGAGPPLSELNSVVAYGVPDDPDFWGRRVAAHRLRRFGDGAAESLRGATQNPGVTVEDLLDTAETFAVALEHAARTLPSASEGRRLVIAGPSSPHRTAMDVVI